MKRFSLVLILSAISAFAFSQNFKYEWSRVAMDTTYNGNGTSKVEKIIQKHYPQIEPLMEIICYSEGEMSRDGVESGLTNVAADMLLSKAKQFIKNDYPTMSITNYGGIRADFPKGAVRLYDIVSTFPFNNKIVIAEIKGEDLYKILSRFAKRLKFEAIGGIKIEVSNGVITKCEIGGKPFDKKAMYNIATIDFLLSGGDSMNIAKNAVKVINTDVLLRDAAEEYLRDLNSKKIKLSPYGDGRIIIK